MSDTYQTNPKKQSITIAYFITIKDHPELFLDLFKKIYNINQLYLVYIDHNCECEIKDKIQTYLTHFSNVYVLDSLKITAYQQNKFETELKAMQYLLNADNHWDFFINLNDSHYPVKSQYRICEFLSNNKDKNFITYNDSQIQILDSLHKIQYDLNVYKPLKSKELNNKKTHLFIGSKWMILNRDTCAFLTYSQQANELTKLYSNSRLASESFFQTILLSSDYKYNIINDNKRINYLKKKSTNSILTQLKLNNTFFISNLHAPLNNILINYIEHTFLFPIK